MGAQKVLFPHSAAHLSSEIKKSPESVLNTCYQTPLSCKLNCTELCVLNAHLGHLIKTQQFALTVFPLIVIYCMGSVLKVR